MEVKEDIFKEVRRILAESNTSSSNRLILLSMLQENIESHAVIWMGHKGVIAQTHYDQSHNFHTAIVGRKRFLLYPPSYWRYLYLFPHVRYAQLVYINSAMSLTNYLYISAHKRQSQVPIDATFDQEGSQDETAKLLYEMFPLFFENIEAIEIVLYPGETLYIPRWILSSSMLKLCLLTYSPTALWFHTVESLDFCVSLSVVSPSREEAVYNEAYWMFTPWTIKDFATQQERSAVVVDYVRYLFEGNDVMASKFVKEVLMDSRYRETFFNSDDWVTKMRLDAKSNNLCVSEKLSADAELQTKLKSLAKDVKELLSNLQVEVRDIYMGNLMEDMAKWVAGGQKEQIPIFLCACLY